MAIKYISWAFETECPNASCKAVLVKLADNANDQGECHPSIDYICKHTQLTKPTVRKSIKLLEESGLVEIERRKSGGVNLSNVYHLTGGQATFPLGKSVDQGVGKPLDQGGQIESTGVGKPLSPNLKKEEPSLNQEREDAAVAAAPASQPEVTKNGTRGTRLPADWKPSAADADFARQRGVNVANTAEQFRDYWIAVAGAKGVKLDWPATWRTWVRRQPEFSRGHGRSDSPLASALDNLMSDD